MQQDKDPGTYYTNEVDAHLEMKWIHK